MGDDSDDMGDDSDDMGNFCIEMGHRVNLYIPPVLLHPLGVLKKVHSAAPVRSGGAPSPPRRGSHSSTHGLT